jgi:transposase
MHVEEHHTLEELQELTRRQQGRRAWKRYQAVVLARQGDTAEQIARALDCGARTAQTWVAK